MPDRQRLYTLLAEKIGRIFENGLWIDRHAIQFLDSVFSNHDVDTLAAALQDPSDCECASLVELLYFPDASIQVQLEAFLEQTAFSKEEEADIAALLPSYTGRTLFRFADQNTSWRLATPPAGAIAFLDRLHIARNLDPRLIDVMKGIRPALLRNRCKVKIRNADFTRSAPKIESLAAFFLKSDPHDRGFDARFHFLLDFLSEWKGDTGLAEALAARKELYIRQLQQTSKWEALHRDRNIETLMVLGIRSPHLDRRAVLEKIALLDDIGLAIFGQTVYVGINDYGSSPQ